MREELHYMDYSSFIFPCQSLPFIYIYQLMGNKLFYIFTSSWETSFFIYLPAHGKQAFFGNNFFPLEINLLKLRTLSRFPNTNLRQFQIRRANKKLFIFLFSNSSLSTESNSALNNQKIKF